MINSLEFISPNQPWPPADQDEKDRLAEHQKNRDIYNNLHEKCFAKYAAYLRDKCDDDKKVPIILGWGEKATTSYVNLCIGEPPDVEVNGVDVIEERPDEEVLIDVSRYGIGLYEVTQDGIQAQNPETCYLVTAPGNNRKVTEYVFFHDFSKGTEKFVKLTIYGKGYIQHIIYDIRNGKLGDRQDLSKFPAFAGLQVDAEGKQKTGVDDLLVVRVDNSLSSERRYGRSDYTPSVASLIEALELAFARREEVLAKFARPVFMAPESAFNHFNHAKQVWEIRTDEPLMLEPGGQKAEYLTWQAELGAVEKAIEEKMDQLLFMLDLSRVLLAGKDAGGVASGEALKVRLIPSLSRVRKYANGLKRAIPRVLSLRSKLDAALGEPGAQVFEPSDVSIVFQDGIPQDQVQVNQWISLAYASGYMSLETAVAIGQGLEPGSEAHMAEVQRIRDERTSNSLPITIE